MFEKYLQVLKLSWQEVFVYRANFILWRVRVIVQLLVIYFFWAAVFQPETQAFGYTRASILTYVLGTSILRSFVLASRSSDVAAEIYQGTLTNFLLRPISYISYWMTRDVADKILNLVFTVVELGVIIWLLNPPIIIQTNPLFLGLFGLASVLALVLYFYFSFLVSLLAFWIREVWAPRFLIIVVLEFLSGGVFPLDILPQAVFKFLSVLPFSYFIFFPLKVYLGELALFEIFSGIVVLVGWIAVMMMAARYFWLRGLRVYSAEGR